MMVVITEDVLGTSNHIKKIRRFSWHKRFLCHGTSETPYSCDKVDGSGVRKHLTLKYRYMNMKYVFEITQHVFCILCFTQVRKCILYLVFKYKIFNI